MNINPYFFLVYVLPRLEQRFYMDGKIFSSMSQFKPKVNAGCTSTSCGIDVLLQLYRYIYICTHIHTQRVYTVHSTLYGIFRGHFLQGSKIFRLIRLTSTRYLHSFNNVSMLFGTAKSSTYS